MTEEVIYRKECPEPPPVRRGIIVRCVIWITLCMICGVLYRLTGG